MSLLCSPDPVNTKRGPEPHFKTRVFCAERRVLAWIRHGGAPFCEIQAGTRLAPNRVTIALVRLIKWGEVEKLKWGWYQRKTETLK